MAALVNGPEGDALDWGSINWPRIEGEVRRLRQRIFTASQAGDLKKVRNLQKLMLRSRANALMSVRRVTELNAGRKTAGVDGKVVVSAPRKSRVSRPGAPPRSHRHGSTRQACVHPEGERKTTPARHSRDRRPRAPGAGGWRAGTRVGGPVRAEILRVSSRPGLPRRH